VRGGRGGEKEEEGRRRRRYTYSPMKREQTVFRNVAI
jgi:hypothetical protein